MLGRDHALSGALAFTATNKLAEHWFVSPLLLAGLVYFLWRDAGFSLTAPNHLAGRLSPAASSCA